MRISRKRSNKYSFMSQINPLLKIAICMILIGFVFCLQKVWSLGLLVSWLLILLFSQVKVKFTIVMKLTIFLGLFVALSTWLLGDFNKSIFSALRLLAITLPTPLLAGTTAPSDLIRALQASRLPGFMVLSLMLIWRFLPIIQQGTQRIVEGNQLRGVNLTRQQNQWFAGLFVPFIFQIVAYADDVTIGLQTRGYEPTAPRSNCQPLTWERKDFIFANAILLIILVISYMEWS